MRTVSCETRMPRENGLNGSCQARNNGLVITLDFYCIPTLHPRATVSVHGTIECGINLGVFTEEG